MCFKSENINCLTLIKLQAHVTVLLLLINLSLHDKILILMNRPINVPSTYVSHFKSNFFGGSLLIFLYCTWKYCVQYASKNII